VNAAIGELLQRLNEERPIRRLGVTRRQLLEELDRPASRLCSYGRCSPRAWTCYVVSLIGESPLPDDGSAIQRPALPKARRSLPRVLTQPA
jgi:hypothetical protein